MKYKIIGPAFVALFISACAPQMRVPVGQIPVATIPPPNLKIEAEHYVSQHLQEEHFTEIRSGAELNRAKNMVERLSKGAGYPPKTFPVHLVNAGEQVNAAAFNGASIVVYQELLKRVKSDDELATVLSHEMGHILAKHYSEMAEQKQRASAVQVGSSILGSVASVATSMAGYNGMSDVAGSVTEGSANMIGYGAFVGSFNRRQEYEADHIGLLVMAKAGYDPRAAIRFWDNSAAVFGSNSSQLGAFFNTHPAESDRRSKLEEALPYAIALFERKGASSVKAEAEKVSTKSKAKKF